jgi:hypothetical protein
MSSKSVSLTKKPARAPQVDPADAWVDRQATPANQEPAAEPKKRMTIDIRASLHRRIKASCASEGTTIADVIREFLEKNYGPGSEKP